jgi:hypothetical protein
MASELPGELRLAEDRRNGWRAPTRQRHA